MFDVIQFFKQEKSGYINIVQCPPTTLCTCLACLAYHNVYINIANSSQFPGILKLLNFFWLQFWHSCNIKLLKNDGLV